MKKNQNNENNENKKDKKDTINKNNKKIKKDTIKFNKGLFTSSILKVYKQKESYSHVHTHVPSELVPSYKILLNLISEIWNTPTLKGFKLLKKYDKLHFYQNLENPKIILVGILDTDFTSIHDICTICIRTALLRGSVEKLKRYKQHVKDIIEFQIKYPINEYYYIGTGTSIAGCISDLFLEAGYLHETITFNPLIESHFMKRSDIKNYRIYLDEDICYLACGQYACNTKVYSINHDKKTFINPIKEYNYLYHLHTLNRERSHSLQQLKKLLVKEQKEKKK